MSMFDSVDDDLPDDLGGVGFISSLVTMAPGGGHCPSLDPIPGLTCGKWARRPGMPSILGPQIGAPQRR
eukprot:9282219-Heterocapsa_arctica.AAC.1